MNQIPKADPIDLTKLSDVELATAIKNLRLLLDLHIDERFRRTEGKLDRGDSP